MKTKKKYGTAETTLIKKKNRAKQPRVIKTPDQIKNHNEAMKGNTHAIKLNTMELKVEAYKQYCDWIAEGKSKESFVFDHPTLTLTHQTMERYIREFPNEFPAIHKLRAEARSLAHWESLGKQMMLGQIEGKIQPAIYQMFMRNKFKWDKEITVNNTYEPEARRLLMYYEGVSDEG